MMGRVNVGDPGGRSKPRDPQGVTVARGMRTRWQVSL